MLSLPTTYVLSKWILDTYNLHVSTLLQVLKAAWTLLKFVLLWHFRICLFIPKIKTIRQNHICFTILLYLHKNTTIRLWKQGKLRMMFLFHLELTSSALTFVWLSIGKGADQWSRSMSSAHCSSYHHGSSVFHVAAHWWNSPNFCSDV